MTKFKIAGVQMDCTLMDTAANLAAIGKNLRDAALKGAKLAIFPECIVTGYCFESKEEAWPYAEIIPGPTTNTLTAMCLENDIYAVVGMLEKAGDHLFNAAVLVGPKGLVGCYRKVHLPYLGVDRFTTSGAGPFAIYDIDGLRVGMQICYDGGFPEPTRCMMLDGVDLVALPTNWPALALKTAELVPPSRALENHIYFAGINRVGSERGFQFIGRSSIASPYAESIALSKDDQPTILYADIDVSVSRNKQIIRIPGAFQLHRINDRHPELYGRILGR